MVNNLFHFFAWQPVHIWVMSVMFGILFLTVFKAKVHYPQLRCLPLFILFITWGAFGFLEREAVIKKADIRVDIIFVWPVFFGLTAILIGLFLLSLIRAIRATRLKK